jgi:hypothetical protein
MFGRLGSSLFGATEFLTRLFRVARRVACVGDDGTHKIGGIEIITGQIVDSNQNGTVFAAGDEVAVNGALFQCSIGGHGTQQLVHGQLLNGISSITPIIDRTYINGKLVVTDKAVAGCGAKIRPIDRKVYVG